MQKIIDFIVKNNIIMFFIILVFTWLIARIASKILSKRVLIIPARLSKKEKEEFDAVQFTKFKMIKRLFLFLIYAAGISIALLSIPSFRVIGTALLASAGFIGLVAGVAAKDSLANLVAGITIAFAQPVRLKDYVKISDEFGQVDELTLLFTVIKTWDNRRLVVPNQVIVSSPIRNYSLEEKEILAEAIIPISYDTDVTKAKKIITEIIKKNTLYSGKKEPEVKVVDLGLEVVTLRVLALARDPRAAYDLSTEIKEQVLLRFPKEKLLLGKKS